MTTRKPATRKKKASTRETRGSSEPATAKRAANERAATNAPPRTKKPAGKQPTARRPAATVGAPGAATPTRRPPPRGAGGVRNEAAAALEVEAIYARWLTIDVELLWSGARWLLRVEASEPTSPPFRLGKETPLADALRARQHPSSPGERWSRGWRAGPVLPDGPRWTVRRSSGAGFQQSDCPDEAVDPRVDFGGWTVGDAIADAAAFLEGSTLLRGTFRVVVRDGRRYSNVVRPVAVEAVCAAWGADVPTRAEQRCER